MWKNNRTLMCRIFRIKDYLLTLVKNREMCLEYESVLSVRLFFHFNLLPWCCRGYCSNITTPSSCPTRQVTWASPLSGWVTRSPKTTSPCGKPPNQGSRPGTPPGGRWEFRDTWWCLIWEDGSLESLCLTYEQQDRHTPQVTWTCLCLVDSTSTPSSALRWHIYIIIIMLLFWMLP